MAVTCQSERKVVPHESKSDLPLVCSVISLTMIDVCFIHTFYLNTQIRVNKVHVNGLGKTEDQLVEKVASQVLQAKTFNDVFGFTKTAHSQLKSLGCFQKVEAVIDTSKTYPNDLEISFNVEELPFSNFHIDMETGDNEALVRTSASVPNLSGHGEKLESVIKLGNFGSQHFSLNYVRPIRSNFLWKMNSGLCGSSCMASFYRNYQKMSWTSLQGIFLKILTFI